jgi:hypothetical protein
MNQQFGPLTWSRYGPPPLTFAISGPMGTPIVCLRHFVTLRGFLTLRYDLLSDGPPMPAARRARTPQTATRSLL